MISIPYKTTVFKLSAVIVVIAILLMFGDIIVSSVLEGLHIAFEVIEVILDNIIEHIFETNVHETQTIVFYIMMIGAIGILYCLSHVLIKLYHNAIEACDDCKANAEIYWVNTTFTLKIVYIAGGISLIVFSLMLSGFM